MSGRLAPGLALHFSARIGWAQKNQPPSADQHTGRNPIDAAHRAAPFPHRRGLIIVTTLATAYVASHFFRASNVTIGLDLMRDLPSGRKPWAR